MTAVQERESNRARGATWRFPLVLFFAVGSVLWVINMVRYSSSTPLVESPALERPVVGGWLFLDSVWYVQIAERGYDDATVKDFHDGNESAVAFFPSYPLTVRGVAAVTRMDAAYAALLTTALSGLATVLLFWRWCSNKVPPRTARLATAMLVLYPYAWFLFGTAYGDAFFLMMVLLAFSFAERRHYLFAGLAGAVASAGRPVGFALIFALLLLVFEREGVLGRTSERTDSGSGGGSGGDARRPGRRRWYFDRSRLRPAQFLVGISAAGIASWCVFLYLRTGDPLAFFTVQSAPGWEQGAGPSTWLKFRFFEFAAERSSHAAFLACQAVAVAVFLAFLPRLARRLGVAYTAYTALIIAVPLVGSADFQGLGRYLLAAFPILLVAAEWLVDRPVLRNLTLVSGGGILALFTWLFARGFYLT